MTSRSTSATYRIIALVALGAMLSGCSSYHPVSDRGDADHPAPGPGAAGIVVGSHVRITRHHGERIAGVVLERDDEALTVRSYAAHGMAAQVVPVAEISAIELRQSEPVPMLGKIAIAGIAVAVGYYLLVGLALSGARLD